MIFIAHLPDRLHARGGGRRMKIRRFGEYQYPGATGPLPAPAADQKNTAKDGKGIQS